MLIFEEITKMPEHITPEIIRQVIFYTYSKELATITNYFSGKPSIHHVCD